MQEYLWAMSTKLSKNTGSNMLLQIISQNLGCPSVRLLISERTIELISLFISCNFCILHEVKIGSIFEKQHQIGHDCVKPSSNLLPVSLQMRHTRVNTEVYRPSLQYEEKYYVPTIMLTAPFFSQGYSCMFI